MPLAPPLPLTDPPGLTVAPARVLVVDDDEANRESLSRRLRRRGMTVDVAADGESAIAAIAAAEFDVVLLDVMMPGMSGLEVLEHVRKTRPATELPIIMATANDRSQDVVQALALGANDYVTKPLDFEVVLARTQTAIDLRRSVQRILALERQLVRDNVALEEANVALQAAAERNRHELELAARVQATYLPREPVVTINNAHFAWLYEPTAALAGDALNVCRLDDRHVGFYVLDVSGHGVAASLTAVTASRLLSPAHDPDSILVARDTDGTPICPTSPIEVARQLGRRFRFDAAGQFFTIFYGLLDTQTRTLRYFSAGHPPAIIVSPYKPPRMLDGTCLPIGVGEDEALPCDDPSDTLDPGERLILYSDGLIESRNPIDGDLFGIPRLIDSVAASRHEPIADSINALRQEATAWRAGAAANDDVSLLMLEAT